MIIINLSTLIELNLIIMLKVSAMLLLLVNRQVTFEEFKKMTRSYMRKLRDRDYKLIKFEFPRIQNREEFLEYIESP
jgi:hypothetical protein